MRRSYPGDRFFYLFLEKNSLFSLGVGPRNKLQFVIPYRREAPECKVRSFLRPVGRESCLQRVGVAPGQAEMAAVGALSPGRHFSGDQRPAERWASVWRLVIGDAGSSTSTLTPRTSVSIAVSGVYFAATGGLLSGTLRFKHPLSMFFVGERGYVVR